MSDSRAEQVLQQQKHLMQEAKQKKLSRSIQPDFSDKNVVMGYNNTYPTKVDLHYPPPDSHELKTEPPDYNKITGNYIYLQITVKLQVITFASRLQQNYR